jgi:hypothetical protein
MRTHEPSCRRSVTVHLIVVFGRKSFVAGSMSAAAAPPLSRKKRGDRNTFCSASSASSRALLRGILERARRGIVERAWLRCFAGGAGAALTFEARGFGFERFRPGRCVTETPAT